MKAFSVALMVIALVALCSANTVTDQEWKAFKDIYLKSYPTTAIENLARYYFAVNKQKVAAHNVRAARNLESYTLAVNQYSDQRFLDFAAMFPLTTEITSNAATFMVPASPAPPVFSYKNLGYISPVQDQGRVCNSGWAYAAAAALKIYYAVQLADFNSPVLSAQNLIDCAGAAKSCINQVSQVAFDYLTVHKQKIYPIGDYGPQQGQGMCVQPADTTNGKTLTSYASIPNGDDVTLMKVVSNLAPVVIKFNPGTFEFMHYKAGIFTQPTPTQSASHYLTVTGYDTDALTGKNYWLVQNSFGKTWGDDGLMKIERNPLKSIATSAIFPLA